MQTIQKPKMRVFFDSWTMFKRCFRISLRNPEALTMALVTPIFLMLLFGAVFGNITDIGPYSYVDFIIPGIILQAVGQASQYTAININTDMTRGLIDRFRSMPITKSAFLTGHALASVLKNMITTAVIIATAFAIGFRPQAGFGEWLIIAGILFLSVTAITCIAILCGLLAKTPESASGLMFPLFILPFISSGFAPTDSMHTAIRWFAEHQPMTPIINSIRALMLGFPVGNALPPALIWIIGTILITFTLAVQIYKRKLS